MKDETQKYQIQDREAGNVIVIDLTHEEAIELLLIFEEQDKQQDIYTPDFYEITNHTPQDEKQN